MRAGKRVCISVAFSTGHTLSVIKWVEEHCHPQDQLVLLHVKPSLKLEKQLSLTSAQLDTFLAVQKINSIHSHEVLKEYAAILHYAGFPNIRCISLSGNNVLFHLSKKAKHLKADILVLGMDPAEEHINGEDGISFEEGRGGGLARFALKKLFTKSTTAADYCRWHCGKNVLVVAVNTSGIHSPTT